MKKKSEITLWEGMLVMNMITLGFVGIRDGV